YNLHDWDREILLKHYCFIGPQPVWRKSLHDEYGYFEGSCITSGDYEFWMRASQTHNFKKIHAHLGLYLKAPSSVEHVNLDKIAIENKKYVGEYIDADVAGKIINRNKPLPALNFYSENLPVT